MGKTMDVIIATRNQGKAREIRTLLQDFDVRVLTLDDFPEIDEIPETGQTFEDNALIKARTVARLTGTTALADDSGLEVEALSGAPGVFSARFSGPAATDAQNNALLLSKMEDVAWGERGARFVSVIAVHVPFMGGRELLARGTWTGRIIRDPRGANGFGYDPLFLDEELELTAAEMEPAEKNKRSHRAAALRRLLESWKNFIRDIDKIK